MEHRRKCISNVLNFEESPKRRALQENTASSCRTHNRPSLYPSLLPNDEKKNTKGLRTLSESVYKIVLELRVTTYKEVAEHLVQMFNCVDTENTNGIPKSKDEQNIKRRVYDALNVLISADVLKKNAKYVISDQEIFSQQIKLPIKGIKK